EGEEPALMMVGERVRLRRPSLSAEGLSRLLVTEVAAILFQSEAPAPSTPVRESPPARDPAPKPAAVGMTWQEAAERLERLRHGRRRRRAYVYRRDPAPEGQSDPDGDRHVGQFPDGPRHHPRPPTPP